MIEIVQSPNIQTNNEGIKLFIAGGISNCPNWQEILIGRLIHDNRIRNDKDVKVIIFNPRCKEIPEDEYTQILWEFDRLEMSDIISFWFSEGSVNPITLFEYGSHFNGNKKIIVGCDPNYPRKNDVQIQTKLKRPHLKVNETFDSFYEEIVEVLKNKIENL